MGRPARAFLPRTASGRAVPYQEVADTAESYSANPVMAAGVMLPHHGAGTTPPTWSRKARVNMDSTNNPAPPGTIVTDDWTRNWHAKIAIKITAMFMWLIILTAFGGLVYFTKNLEAEFTGAVSDELDGFAYNFSSILSAAPPESAEQTLITLKSAADDVLLHSHSNIKALTINVDGQQIHAGSLTPGLTISTRTATFMNDAKATKASVLLLEAAHKSPADYARSMRERLIMTVVSIVLALGFLLRWTIHNVLAKPFQVLMDATQAVSTGNLDLRLDVSREDEFGHLSRFFNQMLDRIRGQQQDLTTANSELLNEVAVRKQAEAELLKHRDELEHLVEQRTQDLELARDQALRASQTKSAFIANISHEIRTPLTPIIGFAEAMMNGLPHEEDRKRSLQSIIRNGKHLLNIINDILDLSKIEADKLEVERIPVRLQQLLADVESAVGVLAREKGLEFNIHYTYPVPGVVHTDPTRLKQVLMNLAMNAIKFTQRGMVSIDASYNPTMHQLVLAVVDTGIGIGPENLQRMFKAFSQADSSTTRQYGGTGLGLYISRRLSRLLGGDIELQSASGIGSRFIVSIDAGAIEAEEMLNASMEGLYPEETTDIPTTRVQGSVLLAEDSPDNQRLISYYLDKAGAEVAVAENGEIAFEMAMAGDYDLILMDMQMPVMGGMEAVELLRGAGYGGVIVALTANAMKEDRERYAQVGCDGFLSKPIELDKFHAVLSKHLKSADTAAPALTAPRNAELESIAAQFRDGLPNYIEQLNTSCTARDSTTTKALVHQLKGMGGAFGYPRITELAMTADASFRKALEDVAFEQALRLIDELNTVCATDLAEGGMRAGSTV